MVSTIREHGVRRDERFDEAPSASPLSPETSRQLPPEGLAMPARLPDLLRYAATDWAAIVAAWGVMALAPAWLLPPAILVVAGRLHALGVVLHDACHMGRRARGPQLALLQWLAGYPIATSMPAMRYHHLRHHRWTHLPQDPYFKPGVSADAALRAGMTVRGLLLVPAWMARAYFGCAALVAPRLVPAYARWFLQDRSDDDLSRSAEVRACLREEPALAALFFGVFALAAAFPVAVTVGYLLPLVLAGAINVHRVIAEHVHVACADRRPETVRSVTVTHVVGVLGRLVLYPHNIGYHVAHHLYPQAALGCLPELDRWMAASSPRADAE